MKTCATCRFTAPPRELEKESLTFFENDGGGDYKEKHTSHQSCVRIIHGNGFDSSARVGEDKFDFLSKEPAAVVDGCGYVARLMVLPSFGCILHEPK